MILININRYPKIFQMEIVSTMNKILITCEHGKKGELQKQIKINISLISDELDVKDFSPNEFVFLEMEQFFVQILTVIIITT